MRSKRTARIVRCYTEQALRANTEVHLDKRSSHHLSTVLRSREGQQVQLFNGDGNNYDAVLTSVGRKAKVSIGDSTPNQVESVLNITLVQAIARGDKMDGIVQKATELGVTRIQPVYSAHAISKLDAKREERKQAHWQSIVISACEQCGRSTLPDIASIKTLEQYLQDCPSASETETRWILSPTANNALDKAKASTDFSVLIGPESGFDPDELDAANSAGFIPLQLGPRVLRTETAGPASIAILQACFGDMG